MVLLEGGVAASSLAGGASAGGLGAGLGAALGPIGAAAALVPAIIRGIKVAKTPEGKQVYKDLGSNDWNRKMNGVKNSINLSQNVTGIPIHIPENGILQGGVEKTESPFSKLLNGNIEQNQLLKALNNFNSGESEQYPISPMELYPRDLPPITDFLGSTYVNKNGLLPVKSINLASILSDGKLKNLFNTRGIYNG